MTHASKIAPLLAIVRRLGQPLAGFLRAPDDVRRYTWQSGTCLTAMYVLLASAMAQALPPWLLLLLIPPLYVRSALGVHELMHARSERQVPWLHRLMMVLESPLSLGYREHRDIHLRHHRYCVSAGDPEFFQIRGGHARALAAAMVSPEWSLVAYVRRKGVSPVFLAEACVRCIVFTLVAGLNPGVFLFYWAALRASIGFSSYAFHHVLHQRGGEYGTFALELPRPAERALRLLIGQECVHILTEHPAHHAWQMVKADRLPIVGVALLDGTAYVDASDEAGATTIPV